MKTFKLDLKTPLSHRDHLASFARYIDHTNLWPTSGKFQIEQLCQEAILYDFATVCVAPRWVATAAKLLSGRGKNSVGLSTVVSFPHGNTATEGKVFETKHALACGASEIEMVISIGDLRDGNHTYVKSDIAAVVDAAHSNQALVKVILETSYLDENEIIVGCQLAARAGADFVKTNTGFGPNGATPEVVRLMRKAVGNEVGVKAAGGIRNLADAQRMLDAGASRLGCSSSTKIMAELQKSLEV